MPSPQDKGYFLELNESFLLAARTVTPGRPTVIEDLREASLDNKTAVSQALSAVFPTAGPATLGVVCSVRPRDRFFLLASEKETPKASSLAALRTLVGSSAFAASGPSELVGVDARTGLPLEGKSGGRWFMAGAPKEALSGVRATLGEWKVAPSRMEVATVSLLGVVLTEQQRTKGAPTLVWEIGEATSDLFLVSAQGIAGVKRLPFGLDQVADSVQAELGMKSRGAATRIFFNEFYDFSEIGPKIASRVAGSLQPAIAEIAGSGAAPAALICMGLASKQNWFSQQLAKALNLAPWQPDVATWCSAAGLTFVGNTLQPKLSPTWLGFLGMMSAVPADRAETESAWHPGWSIDGVEREEKPRIAEVPPAPAPEPVIVPTPVRAPSAPPAPKMVPPTPAVFAAAPAPRPPTAPVPIKAPMVTPAKAPVPAASPTPPAAKQEREMPVRPAVPAPAQKAPAAPARPVAAPAPASPAEPVPTPATAPRPIPAAKPSTSAQQPAAARSFLKTPAFLAVVGVLVVVLGLGAFFYHKFAQQQAAAAAAQAQAEQRANAEAEARHKAELQAKTEAEARKRTEEELAQKNAAAEALAKKALEEAKLRETDANRILNGRGSLVIVTEPAGASIAISNFAPLQSPTTITDLRLGRYTINISLPGYDPLSLEVEIKDNTPTDPGKLRLVRQTSSLEISSEPAGAAFEVRPALPQISVGGVAVKTGKTPATLVDLPTGAYVVTFRRDGWPDQTENVTIEHGKMAHAAWKYVGGAVTITTVPGGARVTRNGEALGVTPLTLTDQQPGEMSFGLDLAGFITTTVEGKIEAEKTLNLSANLGAEDRIVPLRELDERPMPIKMVKPELGYESTRTGGSATISLMVDRDGTPKDLRVELATDQDFAKRCMDAAAQWRFKPGTVKGVPVRTRVSVPFNL